MENRSKILTVLLLVSTNLVIGQTFKFSNSKNHSFPNANSIPVLSSGKTSSLDSIIFIDDNGDTTGVERFTYDANQRLTKFDKYEYNTINNTYKLIRSIELTYNPENLVERNIVKEWVPQENALLIDVDEQRFYHPNGLLKAKLYYEEFIPGQIEKSDSIVFTYNTNNKVIVEEIYNWDNNQWNPTFKHDYSYNTNGGITEIIESVYDIFENDYILEGKTEYIYTGTNISSQVEYTWVPILDFWFEEGRFLFVYNSNNFKTEETYQTFDGDDFVNFERYLWGYDVSGNLINYTEQVWQNNNWVNVYRDLNSFHLDLDMSTVSSYFDNQIWLEDKGIGQAPLVNSPNYSFSEEWDEGSQEWVRIDSAYFYYNSYTPTSNRNYSKFDFKVYPNPTENSIVCQLDNEMQQSIDVIITNNLGQEVLTQTGILNKEINVESLPSGLYHITVVGKSGKKVTTFVKR